MSTTRLTFGAVLGTIQSTAAVITGTLDVINQSTGMATALVTKASLEQKKKHLADSEDFIENLVRERSQSRAISNLKVEEFCAKSDVHREHYSAAYNTFSELLRSK